MQPDKELSELAGFGLGVVPGERDADGAGGERDGQLDGGMLTRLI